MVGHTRSVATARRSARGYNSFLRCTKSASQSRNAGPDVLTLDRELDGGLEVVELVAGVVAALLERERVDRLFLGEQVDRVGELDLATVAGLGLAQRVEDLGREHVAADRGEVRRCLVGGRLLDDRAHLGEVLLDHLGSDRAVGRDLAAQRPPGRRAPNARTARARGASRAAAAPTGGSGRRRAARRTARRRRGPRRPRRRARGRAPRAGAPCGSGRGRTARGSASARRTCPGPRVRPRARASGRSGPRSRPCRGP